MNAMTPVQPRIAVLVVLVIFVVVGVASGRDNKEAASPAGAQDIHSVRVAFHADAGVKNKRILNLGGLAVRASCTDYGAGRIYLGVGAKTQIQNAARALVLSQRRSGEAQTYAFKSSDFDPGFGWYDITGTNPYDTTGTFSFARPDGGQVSLTFRADQGTPSGDCTFDGTAEYLP